MSRRTPVAVPASPAVRVLRALGSLLILIGLIAGLPVALAVLAGNPLDRLPNLDGLWQALTSPDDGSLFLAVLAVVGWLAWAVFTGSVALELFARITRRRTPAIPGLSGPQRIAAVLIAAIAAIAVTPTVASASAAAVVAPPAAVVAPIDPAAAQEQAQQQQQARVSTGAVVHTVERGEGLLDLQDRYGVPWQRIAEANYGVEQPDGRSLQRGQTRIYPGWQMRIPVGTESGVVRGFGTAPGSEATTAGLGTAGELSAGQQQYVVAQDDWLWHISERYLGDPERYQEIADLNPEYADRHGNFPDHIEPGWTLQLPPDAVDRGPIPHATGTTVPTDPPDGGQSGGPVPPPVDPDQEPEPEPPSDPDPAPPTNDDSPPESATPVESAAAADHSPPKQRSATPASAFASPMVGMGAAPAPPETELSPVTSDRPSPSTSAAGAADPAPEQVGDALVSEADPEQFAPAVLTGAGLLAALVLGVAGYQLRRRHQYHRPGFRLLPSLRRGEKLLHTAAQPLDTLRLDAALRHLATALADRTGDLPDVAGALIDGGSVHLLLTAPCPNPPAPWRAHADRWTLPAGAVLPVTGGARRLAPLPTLVAVGSQAGFHLLLDLERLGFLTIHGDPERALNLLRYLAAELACNTWSDTTDLLLAGFPARQAQLLTTLAPDRVRALPSVADAVGMLRHRIASARATLSHTGAADALAGRIQGTAGDAWMPQVLLASAGSSADLAALAGLEQELHQAGSRCAVAVATTEPMAAQSRPSQVTVTADGAVQVQLPFLRASLAAAGLSAAELESLAETVHAARSSRLVPVPPAPEPDQWAAGTDAAGAVRGVGTAPVGAPGNREPYEEETPVMPLSLPVLTAGQPDRDPELDLDLRDWQAATLRPRIGLLGPVTVEASGVPPEQRRRLHEELIVFLVQRAGRGADARMIDEALWPGREVDDPTRQLLISRVRRWLGTDAHGRPWLPDPDANLTYRLADGYLCDWHLFRRLRARAQLRGADGLGDLQAALELVRGVPLAGAAEPGTPGTRNPYPWLAESDLRPDHLVATIVDTAHELAERCLAAGDPAGARWAVQQAWLADPERSYDLPWQDLLRAEHADGRTDQLRAVLAELMELRGVESPAELAPDTYRLISCWPPNVLVPAN